MNTTYATSGGSRASDGVAQRTISRAAARPFYWLCCRNLCRRSYTAMSVRPVRAANFDGGRVSRSKSSSGVHGSPRRPGGLVLPLWAALNFARIAAGSLAPRQIRPMASRTDAGRGLPRRATANVALASGVAAADRTFAWTSGRVTHSGASTLGNRVVPSLYCGVA
jgi:hypothetical protein